MQWKRDAVIRVPMWLVVCVTVVVLMRITPLPFKRVFVVGFTAVLIASAVAPLATKLERLRVPRTLSILVAYLIALGIIAGLAALLVPLIINEINSLQAKLPTYQTDFDALVRRLTPPDKQPLSTNQIFSAVSGDLTSIAKQLGDLLVKIAGILVQILITLVAAYFLAVDPKFAERFVARLAPERSRDHVLIVMRRCGSRLGHWVRAQLLLAVFFGAAFGIGLWVLGVPFALTLGLVGGVLEIIPYIGGFVTLGLALLVALTTDPLKVIAVVVMYTIVTNVEAHVVAPSVMGRMLGLHPLTVVFALFVGAETLGVLGALLSVPVAVVLQVLLDEIYTNRPLPGVPEPELSPELPVGTGVEIEPATRRG